MYRTQVEFPPRSGAIYVSQFETTRERHPFLGCATQCFFTWFGYNFCTFYNLLYLMNSVLIWLSAHRSKRGGGKTSPSKNPITNAMHKYKSPRNEQFTHRDRIIHSHRGRIIHRGIEVKITRIHILTFLVMTHRILFVLTI